MYKGSARNVSIYNLDEVREIYEDAGAKFLDDFYVNQGYKHRYICTCGREAVGTVSSFRKGHRCNGCGQEKTASKKRYDINYVKDFFESRGYKLLSTEYKGAKEKYEYICDCGRPDWKTMYNFKVGKRCRKCRAEKLRGPDFDETERDFRKSSAYRKWRKTVLERDYYECQECSETENLHVHHIVPYSMTKKLRTEEDNGMTLCEDCHKEIHSSIPIADMEEEVFYDYLNRYSFSPEVEIDFDHEIGEVCYDTIIS